MDITSNRFKFNKGKMNDVGKKTKLFLGISHPYYFSSFSVETTSGVSTEEPLASDLFAFFLFNLKTLKT